MNKNIPASSRTQQRGKEEGEGRTVVVAADVLAAALKAMFFARTCSMNE